MHTKPLWDRDSRDRPLIPDPDNPDNLLTYRRVSTFARTLDTAGGLPIWMAAHAVKGAVVGGQEGIDIAKELAESPRSQKKHVDRLVELGGGNQARDTGTNRHQVLAEVLTGRLRVEDAPTQEAREEIGRLVELLDSLGTVSDLEVPVVNHRHRCAGSADYLIDRPDGTVAVVDLKTGKKDGKHIQWALQLGLYASATRWDDGSRVDKGRKPSMFVLHAPQDGRTKPALIEYPVDYVKKALRLASDVDALRKEKP